MQGADSTEWVGKEVKDIYGRRLGRAVGMIFDIGGKVTSVSVEEGGVVTKIDPDRISSDGPELVVIPDWMLESRNVGLDRGGLMKRFSALSLMVSEKRISERLSKEIFAKLSAIQKSHEAVLAKTMARLEELARADSEIDDFVSLVTLQHMAGEMSGGSFDFTARECEKIKAINGKEIIDIRRTLGMATGEQSVANSGDDQSPGSSVQDGPDEGTSRPEGNASGGRVLATSYSDTRDPDVVSRPSWNENSANARTEPAGGPVYRRSGLQAQGREGSQIRHGEPFERPFRLERPNLASAHLGASPSPHSSFGEPSSQAKEVGPAVSEAERSASEAENDGTPILSQRVSEWVFAKIVDLEALDIRPGDYGQLKSLEKKPD